MLLVENDVYRGEIMDFIDMFAGMGTARMAFEQAGHKCVYSIEWDKHKRQIYKVVFENEPEGSDIREVRASELPRSNCFVFGAPCQDFSNAGNRNGLEGDKSSLVREVFRLVREIEEEHRPEWLVYENVKGMLSSNKGFDFLQILVEMDSLGYDIEWQLFNSKNFGVPQNRERVFTIGHLRTRGSRKILPIDPTMDCQNPAVTITARGYGSQRNGTYVIKNPGNIDVEYVNKKYKEFYDKNGYLPKMFNPYNCQEIKDIAPTQTAQGASITKSSTVLIIDSESIRQLTPTEVMRLQGIPELIINKLIKSGILDTHLYKAAGDAWTVNVGYEIARRMEVS